MSTIEQRLMTLFRGHGGAHGTHGTPTQSNGGLKWEIKTTARTLREPVTEELWALHLKGKVPLGVIPINEEGMCFWGSIDVDRYDIDLLTIVSRVDDAGLPLVPGRSKSGGLHLFLFLKDQQPAGEVQTVLRNLAASLGLSGSEIFPKQTQVLTERGDVGNWMVMPYYGDTYGGKIKEQVGLKKTGAEMLVVEFLNLAEERCITGAAFHALKKKRQEAATKKGEFHDGPPCLQYLAISGVPDGSRNNVLFHAGVYYRRAFPNDWKSKIDEFNSKHVKPPLSSEEIQSCTRSLEKKEYEYTCKNEPMVSHCDGALCRTRKFGVGVSGDVPEISGISCLVMEPTIWFVDVGDRRLELSTEELLDYRKFQRVCAEGLRKIYGVVSQGAWVKVLQTAMEHCVELEAAPDISLQGQFQEWLDEFLTGRRKGERWEDLLRGVPWLDVDNRRYVFRMADFQAFLKREGEKMARGKVALRIRAMGGDRDFRAISGRPTNYWWLPMDVVEPVVSVEPPASKGSPI